MGTTQSPGTRSMEERLSGIRLFLLASAVYLACMIPLLRAFAPEFTTSLIGPPGDNLQDFWCTWYSQKVWDTHPLGFFHTQIIKYPEGVSLYYQTFAYSDLILIYLIRKLFFLAADVHTLTALHNGMLLSSFYFSALGAFYLARRFTQNTLSALLAGFIFGFSPFHIAHLLEHITLATIQFIPFFLICFYRALDTGRPVYLAGSIFFYFLAALSCWYYCFYIAYFLLFYYIYQAVAERRLVLRRPLWAVLGSFLGVFLLLSPLLIPMMAQGLRNENVYAPGADDYVADALSYFVFAPNHLLAGVVQSVYAHFTGVSYEMTAYLGLPCMALFVWALWNRKRFQIREIYFLGCGILVFMMFASGPFLHVYGHRIFPLPTLLLDFVPFFRNLRGASRAVVFVYLLMGIGAGLGLDAIIASCRQRRRVLVTILTLLFLFVFLDYYPVGLARTALAVPPAYAVLARDADTHFGILDLPRGYLQGNAYMLYQTFHERPIVVATLSRKVARTLQDDLETRDMDAQKRQLTEKHVKYIFLHTDWISSVDTTDRVDIAAYGKTYPAVFFDDYCVVLRVY